VTNTLTTAKKDDTIIIKSDNSTIYLCKNGRSQRKFYKWIKKNKIRPGDIIPNKILDKYWKKVKTQ